MINKYSNVPLYSQLKSLIIEKIESGEYPENSKIPSEQEFCELYDISRPTVRQAVSELTNNGYLYKEKGKGTFVSRSKARVDVRNYSGFTDSILDGQEPEQQNIISLGCADNAAVERLSEVFGLNPGKHTGSDFAEVKYLSLHNGEALSVNLSYMCLQMFPDIIEDIKDRKPSHEILRGKYPLVPVKTRSSLEIIYTDQLEAQHLKVQTGQPLIKIENVLYSKSGQPVEYIISKYRADKCKLVFENAK